MRQGVGQLLERIAEPQLFPMCPSHHGARHCFIAEPSGLGQMAAVLPRRRAGVPFLPNDRLLTELASRLPKPKRQALT
ncbi:hypothetical protein P9228_06435 [Mesorhizobium sp. WSM4898]|uniref:hypothetical protein n=1 Tax=Mesorhizobium sp. WSM4898 TaxID=3038544 RepID=UPI0024157AF9|nr:hypothetical protein [Mesorhizobium sp. WSM4898]MDG4906085.1 hypothetical protein [Mesorhizobium sp. WSM4898]